MRNITKDELKSKLAKKIKELREDRGWTQEELALKLNFKDKQAINRYEIQGANPTSYNLILLCKAFEINLNDLFDFLDD
ncbi:helix-turn-helix domain-containing protein [Belliella pelovolcani]|uniref:Helix-turn-helix n=1 Tax=Belliella pelovolcani TaxID=529505 RepID=A0A1N7KVP3_9BACT|nr:helix-turn-helix transcriptional regulator [Belliella pelovolcani]SIS65611.1 Helix-turn-helix [Belliella pelovolcani]